MQTDTTIHALTDHEAENPYLVFYNLFDYSNLPHLKEHLWQWLKLTVTGGYTKKEFQYNDRANILTLYEHIEKLLEASYLIYQNKKEELSELNRQILEEELRDEND